MKTLSISILVLMALFAGCKSSKVVKGNYEYLLFKRTGGGQITFSVHKTDDKNKLQVLVTNYKFKDVNLEVTLEKDTADLEIVSQSTAENRVAFANFHKAITGQVQINGEFKQPTLPTGTWASIFVVADKKETEVTNVELRKSLLNLEELVKSKIK